MELSKTESISPADGSPLPMLKGRSRLFLFICIALVAAGQSLSILWPYFARQDTYHFDACQHVWWTYKFADPSLFPNDRIAEYFQQQWAPIGWQWIYRVAVPFVDAQRFSDFIPLVLAVSVWVLAYLLGSNVGKSWIGGVIAVGFVLYAEFMTDLIGGFARSFGLPLLMLGMWALLTRRNVWLGITFVLAALIYPPDVITLGLASAIVLAIRLARERRLPPRWPVLVAMGLIAVATVGWTYLRPMDARWAPKTTKTEAQTMPEWQRGGRNEYFIKDDAKHFYFTRQRSGLGLKWQKALACTILVILTGVFLRRAIPLEAWILVGTALAMWVLAHVTLFTLYLPNRQTVFALPLFAMLWLSGAIPRIIDLARKPPSIGQFFRSEGMAIALRIVAGIAVIGSIVLYAIQLQHRLQTPPMSESTWKPTAGMEDAFAFLRDHTPKDTLLAAHPFDADHIPLRGLRSVIANRETALAYHLGYFRPIPERIEAELVACYATNWADVDALSQFGVKVFLVNRTRYEDDLSIDFYPPHNKRNQERVAEGQSKGFVLLNPPPDRILFQAGQVMLIRVGPSMGEGAQ